MSGHQWSGPHPWRRGGWRAHIDKWECSFRLGDLDGSATSSQTLAHEATRVLGGRIDILVNSAGIFPGNTTATTEEGLLDSVWAVNVKAPFFLVAAIAPTMVARGDGAIINFGSWLARLGAPDVPTTRPRVQLRRLREIGPQRMDLVGFE